MAEKVNDGFEMEKEAKQPKVRYTNLQDNIEINLCMYHTCSDG